MGSLVSKANELIEEHGSVENYLKSFQSTSKQPKAMNFKTFSVTDQNIEVCVHRDRSDEDGEDFVLVTAFIPDEGGEEYMAEATVTSNSETVLKQYISDFSIASAEAFVKSRMPVKD